nr:phage tail protein [Haemophilus influenzae]
MKAFLHHLQNKAKLIISLTYCVDGEFALNEIARATLQQYGIVQLSSATNSDSETEAATSKAVKTAYDKVVEARTTADGKVGLNGNESINGEKTFENRIVAKRNIRISDSQHYASRGDYLNIGANNGDCWFEYKSSNREIGTLRMHANGDLTYKRQKIYHAGAKPQFNTDIEGKPNTLAGYGIGNFKVEEFRGNLNELLTALEQEIEQWQFPT